MPGYPDPTAGMSGVDWLVLVALALLVLAVVWRDDNP